MRINRPNNTKTKSTKVSKSQSVASNKCINDASAHIYAAIQSLGEHAKKNPTDVFAREEIANLGVILMEMKANSDK